jgi:hypothetical protein
MPHVRLVGAAVIYSLVLALSGAGVAVADLLYLISWSPLDGPPDHGTIRKAGEVLFIGAPASFVASLLLTVPLTYLSWRRRPITKASVATLVGVSAAAAALPLAYIAMGLTFVPWTIFSVVYALLGAHFLFVFGTPSVAWWFAAPRDLTGRQGGVFGIVPMRRCAGRGERVFGSGL